MKIAFKSVIILAAMINFNSVLSAARYIQFDKDSDKRPMEIRIQTPAKPVTIPVKIGDSYRIIRAKIFKVLKASDSVYDIQFKAREIPILSGNGNPTRADMDLIKSVSAIDPIIRFKSGRK